MPLKQQVFWIEVWSVRKTA